MVGWQGYLTQVASVYKLRTRSLVGFRDIEGLRRGNFFLDGGENSSMVI